MEGNWTYNTQEDDLWGFDIFETKEEAIKRAKEYFDEDQTEMYIGQVSLIPLPTDVYLDNIFENLDQQYSDECYENDDYLFDSVKIEDYKWLENKMSKLMKEFYKKANISSNYYKIINIEKIKSEDKFI